MVNFDDDIMNPVYLSCLYADKDDDDLAYVLFQQYFNIIIKLSTTPLFDSDCCRVLLRHNVKNTIFAIIDLLLCTLMTEYSLKSYI